MEDVSSDVIINVTLEEDAWKDSFDKLLDCRPVLRELNVLKKQVRASFNMNSSVENSKNDSSKDSLQVASPHLRLPVQNNLTEAGGLSTAKGRCASISTPVGKQLVSNPFKCSLSPISAWKLRFCDRSDLEKDLDQSSNTDPIVINIVDYDREDLDTCARKCTDNAQTEFMDSPETEPKAKTKPMKSKPKRKTSQKHVFFETIKENLQSIKKSTTRITQTQTSIHQRLSSRALESIKDRPTSLLLQPGKWRKSLTVWRRTQNAQNRISTNNEHSVNIEDSLINTGVVIVGRRKSIFFTPHSDSELSEKTSNIIAKSIWQQRVLKLCKQTAVAGFEDVYKAEEMTNCKKIGEGAYGEVFIITCDHPSQDTVLKIIPIEGKDLINGEVQKSFEQILPEIVISVELSNLKDPHQQSNFTSGYVGIKKVVCVKGKYPAHLLSLWEDYDNEKGSENDNPDILPSDQHYIVLELAYSGKDLEGFVFNNAEQSYYALQQIILTLAVGEESFSFEHRDLHWGNILVINTAQKHMTYKLQEKTLTLPTKGVKITIIDYTLSRMSYEDCCLYNDLSYDEELFSATGDYQFDIYRMMRDVLKNKWETFEPKTNVFWLSYLTRKMLQGVNYKNTGTKTHSTFIRKLKQLEAIILDFSSATDCAKYLKKL